jgi:hypothetical protein
MKYRSMRWSGQVASMGRKDITGRDLEKTEEK